MAKTLSKTAYDKWREKYGVGGTQKNTTNNSDKGEQSKSASSNRTSTTETHTNTLNSKNAYDKWREKYGVKSKPSVSNSVSSKTDTTTVAEQLETLKNELFEKKMKYTDEYWQSIHDEAVSRFRAEGQWDSVKIENRAWSAVDELRRAWDKEKEEIEKQIRRLSGVRDATWKDATYGSLNRGYMQSRFGDETYDKMFGVENESDAINERLQSKDYQFEADGFVKEGVSGAAELIGQMAYMFSKPETLVKVGASTAAGAGIAAQLGQAGPQIGLPEEIATVPAGALLGFKVGMGTATAESALRTEAGHAYNEMIEHGISHETAQKIALAVGTVNATLEVAQVDELVDAFKVLKKSGATSTVAEKIFKELLDRGVDVAVEVGQEVAQEGSTMLGTEVAYEIDKGERLYTWGDVEERLDDTIKSSALSFGMMNVPAAATNIAFSNYNPNVNQGELEKEASEVTREQVKKLIASNEVYINEEQNVTVQEPETKKTEARTAEVPEGIKTLEQAAMEVVQSREAAQKSRQITVDDVKNATKFGDSGSVLIAKLVNEDGMNFEQATSTVDAAYRAGLTGLDINQVNLVSNVQKLAFKAGADDRVVQDRIKQAEAEKASVYNTGFTENEYSAKLSPDTKQVLSIIAKDLKMDVKMVDQIIADYVNGKPRYANASHEDGVMRIASASDSVVFTASIHESFHRMRQLDSQGTNAFMNFLYEDAEQNAKALENGDTDGSFFEQIKNSYDGVEGMDNTIDFIEEVSAKHLETIITNPEKFLELRKKIDANPQMKSNWQKLVEVIKEILEDIWAAITRSKLSLEQKRQAQAEIGRVEQLFMDAYKGAMREADTRAIEKKFSNNLEIKTNEEYNGNKQYSVNWHTDLNKTQYAQLEKWIRQAGYPESTKITDTANWYEGRMNGEDLFAIYSSEVNGNPTILYERKGSEGKAELKILLGYLGEVENGRSIVDVSEDINTLLGGDWLHEQHNLANNNAGSGGRGSNTGNAPVLQGKSSKFIGSQAFRNVVKNLFDIQTRKKYSLKDSFSTDGMTESEIENAQNVISSLKTYAMSSKYVDGFASYTSERIESVLADSSSKTEIDFASSYITWVDPIDFIYATTSSEQSRAKLREEAGQLDIARLTQETQPIHLTVNFETGEITGHEGRHRMLALQQAGIDKVAVVIDALNDDRHNTKPIEIMHLKGQVYGEYQKGTDMFLHNMLPLSKRYADTARGLFTNKPKSGIRFSLKEDDKEQINLAKEFSDSKVKYSLRKEEPPQKTILGYKVFVVKDGKLYPPMVANPNAEDTPVGVWLNADIGATAPDSKTGRKQVKAGGKGTQGGSGSLAFRPGWHLGEMPMATQFNRMNPETGIKELFPENFVWAECEVAADIDYQEEAMSYGYTDNGKFRHSYAGLPRLPIDGYYKYRTNPNPETVPWLITGAMKVNRVLSDAEVAKILRDNNVNPPKRQGGEKTLKDLGLERFENIKFSLKEEDISNLSAEEQKAVTALGKGAKVVTDKNGDMLIATNKNKSTVMYSLKTYENGGREALGKALRANGHTEEEIAETLSYVDDAADYLTILAAGYAKTHNYDALANHLIADVIVNVKTGKQVISSIVNNGEYPVNIDLALICKKRVAYMNLMNRLIEDGIFDKVNYDGEAIAKVNDLLRTDGFETACLGCFVESRRLQFQTWAETIVSEWNAEVDKRTKNAGSFSFAEGKAKLTDADMDALAEELKNAGKKNAQGNLNLGQGSVQTRMGRLLDKVPSLRKHLTVADLLTPNGITSLREYDSNLFSLVKSRYGAASPKIVQDYNPYASEIAMMTFASVKNITSNAVKGADSYRRKVINEMGGRPVKQKGESNDAFKERRAEFNAKVEDEAIRRYLYDIGGARIQSFSDFMIENVFDYIQIFADLSAKRLPLHGYTKEIIALRLFGMTGAKWNGSWIAHTDRDMGKEYAGLLPASEAKNGNAILVHTDDGDYAIGFDDYARYKATNKKTFIQSIGMKDMIAIQLDPRYSPYVGSITIGVSDKQILAMLDSPLFRYIIPYHASGMLPQFAKLVGVDMYNDYTDYQNTTVNKWYDAYGNPCDPIKDAKGEILKVDTSYNFNAEVQKTGDAKKAAANYLKWCGERHPVYDKDKKRVGYVTFSPKFSDSPYGTDFTKHENYYKLLEDFNVYDSITEESAVQGAVTMTFPSEQNRLTASEMEAYKARLRETGVFSEKEIEKYAKIADKTFKELIADEVKGRAEYQQEQSPKWENTVKKVENMLLKDHKREAYSLKDGIEVSRKAKTEYYDAVEAVKKGEKGSAERLAKYVDSGMLRTEAYDRLIEKYGAIRKGENPSRDVQVPKKTDENKNVSQTVRTILEAKATPDEILPTIEKMVEDGVFSYDVYTDKQAISDANTYIKEYGWDESLDDWFDDVEKGIVSKQHTAMGWALYNNAVNLATTTTSETEKTTATKTALKILDAMVRHQRSAAQALQATRILKKLSPETQLYGVQKSVEALQKELTDKYGKKAPDLKVDEELAEQFINAKTPEERVEIEKEIYKDIGRQMPSRFIDKWNAWRYLAMLGNARTHVRNVLGNAFFAPVVGAKNVTATAIESIVHRVSGKKTIRGKSIVWGSKSDRALLKEAWNDYANVAGMISNGGKYNDSAMANQQIEEGRQIFKFKPLEWARKKNSELLELEDMWFAQPHYAFALAQYCKANNITPEQIARGKAIAPARDYAIREAQKATYRDTNAFSQLVSSWGRSGNDNVVKKAFSTVIEGILPFRKTPANILVRGVEYSPLGLLKGLSYDLVQVRNGKISSSEVIDNISAGLTGTGLLALGVLLAAQGLIRGHGGEDKEEKEFKELMGHQSYALELPNGESITLDWLAPEALPFFVGVNIWETSTGTNEEVNLATILQAVSGISEPMLEMSCLQSLNDLFESIGYASSNDTPAVVSVLSSAVTSYLTQGLPTLLGQAERTGEENRMTTYTEKNDFFTGDVQYTIGKASAKIPFWDYHQIPFIDAWGRKEASGMALKRGLNNFLNPAYTSTIETSKMEKELLRLFEKTGESGVFPSRADKYFTVDSKRKDLTANEYVRYATLKGEKSYKLVSELVKSDAYKSLDDAEKVDAIKEAYNYANQKAKQAISNYEPQKWVYTADEFGDNAEDYIAFKTEISGIKADKKENDEKFTRYDVIDVVQDMAQTSDDMWRMYLTEYDSKGDRLAYDNGIDGETYLLFLEALKKADKPNDSGNLGTYTQAEAKAAIGSMKGLTQKEKRTLYQSVNTTWKKNPY